MATQEQVKDNPNYILVHNAGFVGLVDHMGSDKAICEAARVSYGEGTKTVREDRDLLRYLIRHRHTSPLEMAEVKFHIKLPIFVMRQLVRHRTANLNEYSGRYSEMVDEFYLPEEDYLEGQSQTNKQGRAGKLCKDHKENITDLFQHLYKVAYRFYKELIEPQSYSGEDKDSDFIFIDEEYREYPGLSRELSRIILPVGNYTECYWKMDLHNLFHMLKLRLDPHAQREIRDFAEAIYLLVQPLFPLSCEAFNDYIRNSKTLSRLDISMLTDFIQFGVCGSYQDYGMSKREYNEMDQFITECKIGKKMVPEYIVPTFSNITESNIGEVKMAYRKKTEN